MVRNKRYKLIHYLHLNRYQLFDLSQDPHEMRDLSDDTDHQEIFIALKNKLGTKDKD
jgi:arylsulfatase A-like enzyme